MDVESKDFHEAEQGEGPTAGGSLCLVPDSPTPGVLQPPSGPIGSGDGCLSPRLVQGTGIRHPPMVPNRQSSVTSAAAGSRAPVNCASMESPDVVSQPVGTPGGLPPPNPQELESNCSGA